jgi:hypothetical protein
VGGSAPAVRALDGTTEIVHFRVGAVLPALGTREVGHAELAVHETLCLVRTHAFGAVSRLTTFFLGATSCVVGGFAGTHSIAELDRGSIDVAVAVLAQGLERVLRIPRHSSGDP